jgi:CheY-like chemotaxis protein
MLEQRGYLVTEAADGADALDHLARQRPDVVVADLLMPMVVGAELVRRIRATAEIRTLPVILLSGNGDKANDVHAADLVLVKPFDLADLVAAVENMSQHYSRSVHAY